MEINLKHALLFVCAAVPLLMLEQINLNHTPWYKVDLNLNNMVITADNHSGLLVAPSLALKRFKLSAAKPFPKSLNLQN